MELEQLRTKVQILEIKVSYLETQIQNIQDSLRDQMKIALVAEDTCTKSSIPSLGIENTSALPEDKGKEKKVIGTPSQGKFEPITGKEDIQDTKNCKGSSSQSHIIPELDIEKIDPKEIVKI